MLVRTDGDPLPIFSFIAPVNSFAYSDRNVASGDLEGTSLCYSFEPLAVPESPRTAAGLIHRCARHHFAGP